MNDLTPHKDGGSPDRRNQSDDKAASIRQSLEHIHRHHLAPYRAWDDAQKIGHSERQQMRMRPQFLVPQVHQPDHPKTEQEREQQLGIFDHAMLNQPSRMDMAVMRRRLAEAAGKKPDPKQNRLIAGLMVGAFPNVRPYSPETYMESLIAALNEADLPPAAIAKACNHITRTCAFPPTVAEVAQAASDAYGVLNGAINSIDQFNEILDWASEVRSWLKSVPLLAENNSNRDRPPAPPKKFTIGRNRPGSVGWV